MGENGDGSSADSVVLARSAYCPFSIGPRGCVGRGLAVKELMIIVARVVWLYDMRTEPGTALGEGSPGMGAGRERVGEFQMRDMFVGKGDGPMVEFKRVGR